MLERVANYRHEWDRQVAVWTRQEDLNEACKPFDDARLPHSRLAHQHRVVLLLSQ